MILLKLCGYSQEDKDDLMHALNVAAHCLVDAGGSKVAVYDLFNAIDFLNNVHNVVCEMTEQEKQYIERDVLGIDDLFHTIFRKER